MLTYIVSYVKTCSSGNFLCIRSHINCCWGLLEELQLALALHGEIHNVLPTITSKPSNVTVEMALRQATQHLTFRQTAEKHRWKILGPQHPVSPLATEELCDFNTWLNLLEHVFWS